MGRRNRILIVEDDPACRAILGKVVRDLDPRAQVDQATSAETAALTLVQERGSGMPYDLVIADLFLDGKLTGLDLWRIYREFQPAPPVVLTSSLSFERYLAAAHDDEPPPFLPKPFFAEECRQLVKRFLANL
jgi:CheY-like chemotaxis protein